MGLKRTIGMVTGSALLLVVSLAPSAGAGAPGASSSGPTAAISPRPARAVCALAPDAGRCQAKVLTTSAGAPLASPGPNGLTPTQLQGAYGLAAAAAQPNSQTVGVVVAFDDPTAEADLATAAAAFGLPACTTANGCFAKVNQTGGTSYPATDEGWALEASLDIQTIHAVAPHARVLLVEAKSASIFDLLAAENYATAHANVVNNSWGSTESVLDRFFDSAFAKPIPITVSSGDNGFGVSWPASNPFVTAVGGTTLHVDAGGNRLSETTWAGSGSGCSSVEPKAPWQKDTGCARRTVADVAAVADPATGMSVYDSFGYQGQSGWFVVGGTSLASPVIAATYALAAPAPVLYAYRAYVLPGALHDITAGSNGACSPAYLCTAVTGYDGPTGLGSPNGILAF